MVGANGAGAKPAGSGGNADVYDLADDDDDVEVSSPVRPAAKARPPAKVSVWV